MLLPVSHELLHGNRELPANFVGWIGVADHTLPTKGTELKVFASTPSTPNKKDDVCVFVQSEIWKLAGLDPRRAPHVIPETAWEVPESETMRSNEGHRSLTEFQQTAQWLGGTHIPAAVLTSLVGSLPANSIVVCHNITPYDACFEKAVMSLGGNCKLVSISSTPKSYLASFVTKVIQDDIVEAFLA